MGTKKTANVAERAVVVCTDKKGVFFGYTDKPEGEEGDPMFLSRARMCQYWSADTRGVLGLAATGPMKGSRVGASVTRIKLIGITAVIDCSPEATKQWETGIWS